MKNGDFYAHMNHHQNHQFPPQTTHPPPIHHHPPHQNHQFPPQTIHLPPIHHHHNPSPNLSIYSDYEKNLIEEVLYLHSLWRRGPPSPPPPPSSSSRTNPRLKPTHTTQFKKKKQQQNPPPCHVSDKEWPVSATPPSLDGPGWPEFKPNNNPISRPATAEERVRVLGVRIQLKGMDSCSCLFRRRDGGGDAEEEDEEEGEEEEEEDDGDDEDEVDFFEKLFEEDGELRGYYEKNCENGEFYCLVCGVLGDKLGRKYKNCVALVQHSVSVSKTKKRKAHRAYGNVICKVLGWDVDRLPSLPPPAEPLVSTTTESELKNHNDEDSVVEMEIDAALTKQSQAETETIPDAPVEDDIPTTVARCVASKGEVKNYDDEDHTAVPMEGDAANARSQGESEDIPNAIENDDAPTRDGGCIASKLIQSESGSQGSAIGLEVDQRDSNKNSMGSNPENAMSQQENDHVLDQKAVVNKTGEGCGEPVEH